MVSMRMPLSTITIHSRQGGSGALYQVYRPKQDLILLQIGLAGTPATAAIATFFCLPHFHWRHYNSSAGCNIMFQSRSSRTPTKKGYCPFNSTQRGKLLTMQMQHLETLGIWWRVNRMLELHTWVKAETCSVSLSHISCILKYV